MARKYKGDSLLTKTTRTTEEGTERIVYPYFPSKSLVEAVNLALYLGRPLLLMGDPGCGKSILASTIAYEWYGKDPEKYANKYFRWDIKSRTESQDGIYTYDAIFRLRRSEIDTEVIQAEARFKKNPKMLTEFYVEQGFIEEGGLKQAIDNSTTDEPAILLIDEIDKASIDFPNDLLVELDEFEYTVRETGYRASAKQDANPFVIITSNNEKPLPPAFLRRCVYHFISFPDEGMLKNILTARYGDANQQDLLNATVDLFNRIRLRLEKEDASKRISTAELINWYEGLLNEHQQRPAVLNELQTIQGQLDDLKDAKVKLPLHYALLKSYDALLAILPENMIHEG